jgi:aldehyde dehydrogenase (NAD+)
MTHSDHLGQFYIDGAWRKPGPGQGTMPVENPATEEAVATVALGSTADADRAVTAARAAFDGFSATPVAERIALLRRVHEIYRARAEDFAEAITAEMGAPLTFSREAQVWAGDVHIAATIEAGESFEWEAQRGQTRIVREGIGVAGMITPWNWPMNQIACKVAPALVAGCTMVLKPSEIAPLSGVLFAEVMDAAGVPKGVFNLVNGTGPEVGAGLAAHPQVDMVSFTGSTRAGIFVAQAAAPTVKRVAQELGGKSPNIILGDADLEAAVTGGVEACFANSGQSCDAPTRMFVRRADHAAALEIARAKAEAMVTGDPRDPATDLGPVVSRVQFDKIQGLIQKGIDEGAVLVAGGTGRPKGLNRGYFVRPTVFGGVTQAMTIAREEIFGPVLSILPYDDEDRAVAMANDTPYGLAAYVQGARDHARAIARRLRAGQVQINYPEWDVFAPFGGYKQSGNGREYADWAIHDFCEVKGIVGYGEA